MAEEKVVTVTFRKQLRLAPRDRRKKHFVNYLRSYLKKKSPTGKVKIDMGLNKKIWETASGKPIGKFRIKITKRDDGTVVAEQVE